ncbi:hypothetical protein WKI68_24345 [Streptomyces sp. MS1.HAVA.3]|uniref:Protein kinase domain-containing protein n=1 Tax=Streptomyces caledonius TaxID=3134107 RepID=A0ABU8U7I7_9ACTN
MAVKVIRDEITGHPEALARFRREAETVRAVRSAYTANLIDASLESAPYWLATEYVAGPALGHAVGRRGALPAETCRRLFAALAEGLASVHAYGSRTGTSSRRTSSWARRARSSSTSASRAGSARPS